LINWKNIASISLKITCATNEQDQDEEMIALRDSIKQLIELTEQQLLENKKQELLNMLPQESPPSSPVARGGLISEGPYFGLIFKTRLRNYCRIAPFHF
jgi:hypothetical protein